MRRRRRRTREEQQEEESGEALAERLREEQAAAINDAINDAVNDADVYWSEPNEINAGEPITADYTTTENRTISWDDALADSELFTTGNIATPFTLGGTGVNTDDNRVFPGNRVFPADGIIAARPEVAQDVEEGVVRIQFLDNSTNMTVHNAIEIRPANDDDFMSIRRSNNRRPTLICKKIIKSIEWI